jgi:hypothetical protein
LLDGSARIRFVPDAPSYFGPGGTITFRTWDQTLGTDGQTGVNIWAIGGNSPFSIDMATAAAHVNSLVLQPAGGNQDPGVNENALPNEIVGTLAASPDVPGSFTYALDTLDPFSVATFSLDSTTGLLTVIDGSQLDYEQATAHTIVVHVTHVDTGGTTSYSESIVVPLFDVNDMPPVVVPQQVLAVA